LIFPAAVQFRLCVV